MRPAEKGGRELFTPPSPHSLAKPHDGLRALLGALYSSLPPRTPVLFCLTPRKDGHIRGRSRWLVHSVG